LKKIGILEKKIRGEKYPHAGKKCNKPGPIYLKIKVLKAKKNYWLKKSVPIGNWFFEERIAPFQNLSEMSMEFPIANMPWAIICKGGDW